MTFTRSLRRHGTSAPGSSSLIPSDVALANGAVKLDAVILYADLAHSTRLARKLDRSVTAKIVRAYLSTMTQLVKNSGGEVRSFDGDRVMGVFVGASKNSSAANCALKMNYVVSKILRPKAEARFPSLAKNGLGIAHCVGIHASPVLVVRGWRSRHQRPCVRRLGSKPGRKAQRDPEQPLPLLHHAHGVRETQPRRPNQLTGQADVDASTSQARRRDVGLLPVELVATAVATPSVGRGFAFPREERSLGRPPPPR